MTDTEYYHNLAVAQTMLLSDTKPPGTFDALYIPGLSVGMIESGKLLQHLSEQYRRCGKPLIVFNGSDGERFSHNEGGDQDRPMGKEPGAGWSGKWYYFERLCDLGVPHSALQITGPGYHTRHEMAQLVAAARQYDWKLVGIVTVPWHYASVFTMLVDAMKKKDHFFAAYAMPPAHTNWLQQGMAGSQGLEKTTPGAETSKYLEKLAGYQKGGRACSFGELFDYLHHREDIARQDAA